MMMRMLAGLVLVALAAGSVAADPIDVNLDLGPLGPNSVFDPDNLEPPIVFDLPITTGVLLEGYRIRFNDGKGLMVEFDRFIPSMTPRFSDVVQIQFLNLGGPGTIFASRTLSLLDSGGNVIATEFEANQLIGSNTSRTTISGYAPATIYGVDFTFDPAFVPPNPSATASISFGGNLTIVPEPASAMLLALGGLALATTRRRAR